MQIGFAKLRKILEKWGHVHGFLVVIVVSDSSMQKSYKSEQILQINFLSNAEKKVALYLIIVREFDNNRYTKKK